MHEVFRRFAKLTSDFVGNAWTFVMAIVIIVIWGTSGPLFNFSDTWQLVINTGTTIVTFLMVFLIQNTQNRESKALHIKLDEVIRSIRSAKNQIINAENMSDEELEKLMLDYGKLCELHEERKRKRHQTHPPQQ